MLILKLFPELYSKKTKEYLYILDIYVKVINGCKGATLAFLSYPSWHFIFGTTNLIGSKRNENRIIRQNKKNQQFITKQKPMCDFAHIDFY